MTHVLLKITSAGSYASVVQGKLRASRIENGTVLLPSGMPESATLSEHLVWLWGSIKHERRVLKTAVAGGAKIVCECKVPRGVVHLLPNAAEMLHLIGAELVLEAT
jgi:hypothetical protein